MQDTAGIRVKEIIEKGKLLPGQKLIQEKLAVDLGVSRTPLLKALQLNGIMRKQIGRYAITLIYPEEY